MLWAIIMFLVKIIVILIFIIVGAYIIMIKCVNPASERGIDLNDFSNSDSQMAWALILIMLGGLCIALDALLKIFGWSS